MRATLVLFLMLAVNALASATGFVLSGGKPTGGTLTGGNAGPYYMGTGGYGGTTAGTPGTATQKVTFTYTWGELRQAPKNVIIVVDSFASWTGSPGGTCSNGLGHPVILTRPHPLASPTGAPPPARRPS